MAVNKVVFGGQSIIDISDSTVTADKMLEGVTAYDKTGAKITGTIPQQAAKTVTAGTSKVSAGVSGKYMSGEITVAPTPSQSKTVSPSTSAQTVKADSGKLLYSVTVNGYGNMKQIVNVRVPSVGYVDQSGTTVQLDTKLDRSDIVVFGARYKNQNLGEYVDGVVVLATYDSNTSVGYMYAGNGSVNFMLSPDGSLSLTNSSTRVEFGFNFIHVIKGGTSE